VRSLANTKIRDFRVVFLALVLSAEGNRPAQSRAFHVLTTGECELVESRSELRRRIPKATIFQQLIDSNL
jgi:hypothetical protein